MEFRKGRSGRWCSFKRMWFSGSSCYLSRGVAPSDRTATLQPRHLANKKDFHPALSQTGICRKGSCGFLGFFSDYSKWKNFWEPNKIKATLVPFFKLQGFWCFLVPFPLWIFAANFGGYFFLCSRVKANDEILHDLFGLLIYGYLEGVYTQYIAYHRSSFMNEYSITNPDTKLYTLNISWKSTHYFVWVGLRLSPFFCVKNRIIQKEKHHFAPCEA